MQAEDASATQSEMMRLDTDGDGVLTVTEPIMPRAMTFTLPARGRKARSSLLTSGEQKCRRLDIR